VRTEDHLAKYLESEGIISKGEYRAGNIDIWDRGTYRLSMGVDAEEEAAARVGGELRKARAISFVVRLHTSRRVNATRSSMDRAGWRQVNTRRS
jgi:hypothetical protein